MICEHLRPLEEALIGRGYSVTYRGQTWTRNCREWVYFDCVLALADIRQNFAFDACVEDHVHRGTHEGSEQGFVATGTGMPSWGPTPKAGSVGRFTAGIRTTRDAALGLLLEGNPDGRHCPGPTAESGSRRKFLGAVDPGILRSSS